VEDEQGGVHTVAFSGFRRQGRLCSIWRDLKLWPGGKKAFAKKRRTPLMSFQDFAKDKVDTATTAEMVALLDNAGRYRLTC
jgi:hypothetical protein